MAEENYLSAFERFAKNGSVGDPSWVRQLRERAISRFTKMGFPTARRGNEEWKYTNIGPIAKIPFQSLPAVVADLPQPRQIERFLFGKSSWSRLVFVNGNYAEELSRVSSLPDGVTVGNLAEAITKEPELVEKHLARYASYETKPFTALNTAFVRDGAFIQIPDGILLEEPIHLLFLSTQRDRPTVSHPRLLILIGRESKATIIESYGSLASEAVPRRGANGGYFTNGVTEVVVGEGATVDHYRLQEQSPEAFHIVTANVALARDSSYSSVTLDIGGKLARNNLNLFMGAEGASCSLNGLYLVTDSQHVDNQVVIDHAKSHTTSRELYKGILDGKSRAVFGGSIVVRKNAQKVDAQQSDKNLLLSDEAEADTKPAFWIYADDVKCAHGAACGKLDPDALFYLQSRGMSDPAARRLLTRGFVSEVIQTIASEPVRAHVDKLVTETLGRWLDEGRAA